LPTYTFNDPIKVGDVFDPERQSACFVSVKLKTAGDLKAGNTLRPIGMPRSLTEPLPYIALHLELGCETTYRETQTKIVSRSSKPAPPGEFERLVDEWVAASKKLEQLRKKKVRRTKLAKQRAVVGDKRTAMDSCNRFSIFVRGASRNVYGILKDAGIEKQFATLLNVVRASLSSDDDVIRHMRPYEHLGKTSAHTAWTTEYVLDDPQEEDGEDWEDDVMDDMDD
jgi:hypothetical protein